MATGPPFPLSHALLLDVNLSRVNGFKILDWCVESRRAAG